MISIEYFLENIENEHSFSGCLFMNLFVENTFGRQEEYSTRVDLNISFCVAKRHLFDIFGIM